MIFDIEADGLLDEATLIHCMAYTDGDSIKVTSSYDKMKKLLFEAKYLIGHNIILYDIPVLEKILNIKIKAKIIDTLAVAWYIHPNRNLYGLEWYGKEYGIQKPEILDWKTLSQEQYEHRCKEDVRINKQLWENLKDKLILLYGSQKEAKKIVSYLSFKLSCVEEQHRNKFKINKKLIEETLQKLIEDQKNKVDQLKPLMPKVEVFKSKTKPKKPYKKSGELSSIGEEWFYLLKERCLPLDTDGPLTVKIGEKEPNPNSSEQIKDWLFSLGWKPESFDYKRDNFGKERAVPQIRIQGEEGKELCPSVKAMFEDYPELVLLEDLTVLQHRIGILEGFLENEKNGYLIADIGGLTNTLRFKHRILVNLPGVNKPYGKEIRGSLIAEEGYLLCGSDMSSLEENTKKHYMYYYDPQYVKDMSEKGFDAHLDLAKHAKALTKDEIDFYKSFKEKSKQKDFISDADELEKFKRIDNTRKIYKTANYACIYGVGEAKLARTTKLSREFASSLIEAYWKRNWAVRKLAEDVEIKTLGKEMWVKNPVSGFWLSLRNKKDIFSTLNQSTGVYCFDLWIREVRKSMRKLLAQFHDEIIERIEENFRDECEKILTEAINKVNDILKLNVVLGIDIKFGKTYADIH